MVIPLGIGADGDKSDEHNQYLPLWMVETIRLRPEHGKESTKTISLKELAIYAGPKDSLIESIEKFIKRGW